MDNNASIIFGATVAVGKDNFESFIDERHTFIDKPMLMKEFIESSDSDLTSGTWDDIMTKLRKLVAIIYREYRYIIDTLYPDEKDDYITYPTLEFALKNLSSNDKNVFKVVDDMKNLQNIAQKALNQIEEKQYRATLQHEVRKVLEIGIAFKGKMSCVLGRSLRRNENNTWSESSQ
ncbi:834_t:CDS:2 [Funneliformis geosporum]|nr:834_t:CDS:2 [Funneliformis geosporum]